MESGRRSGRIVVAAAGVCGLVTLVLACFGPVLLGDRQFAFRDAGQFYYPLYQRVQEEWRAGRLPLWEPGENGGAPLLGNPTAAVLYPGKLVYAALPYPWAARLYIVAHTVLAGAGMVVLLRSWGVSGAGSAIGGLSYAFGGPVLFQYCNVIYLVGAAWLPFGFRAADRWLRLGKRGGLIELTLILALMALGGDLQAGYLLGLCAGGYAVGLTLSPRGWRIVLLGMLGAWVAWMIFAGVTGPNRPVADRVVRWSARAVLGLTLLGGMRRRGRLRGMLAGLAVSGALAFALAGAQLVPVAENLAASARWAEDLNDSLEDFSLEPYRVVEWAWPETFGDFFSGNRSWLSAMPPKGRHRSWVPSLYFGALPLALALGAVGFRSGPPERAWLSAVAGVGLVLSFGKYADPSTWLGQERGGSPFGLLAAILPGFDGFRYPSKWLVPVSMALSGLAGIGWDRVASGAGRRPIRLAAGLAGASLVGLVLVSAASGPIIDTLSRLAPGRVGTLTGRFDPAGAWADGRRSLAIGALMFGGAGAVLVAARRRPGPAAAIALILVAADLAIAGRELIVTLPQAEFRREPAAAQAIREAEEDRPEASPFRVYHLPSWPPSGWGRRARPARADDLLRWERDGLLPGYGVPVGVSYTLAVTSSLERGAYARLFQPYTQRLGPQVAASIGARGGQVALCYPRRAFDLWGTRYFLLPVNPGDWASSNRSFLTFLDETEVIYPRRGSGDRPLDDLQIRRNLAAFPRAWIVRDAVFAPPGEGAARMATLLYDLSRDANSDFNPRVTALIEVSDPSRLKPYLSSGRAGTPEVPRIVEYGPQRVEIEARMGRPGIVILADLFDRGWRLSIDGKPADVLQVNGLMRGAAVGEGSHRLVYTYRPASLGIGVGVSIAGALGLVILGRWTAGGDKTGD